MEFLIGLFVDALVVGGVILAKVKANAVVARAETPQYLSGKGRVVVPTEPERVRQQSGYGEDF